MTTSEDLYASSVLDTILSEELTSCGSHEITIHAGHYALFRDRDKGYCDYLRALDDRKSGLGFEDFSRLTWRAACRSIAANSTKMTVQLMVLVNDWQFLSPGLEVRRENERAIFDLREQYYLETPMLPNYHLQEMGRHNISTDLILRDRQDRWLFSETALRNEVDSVIREVWADELRAIKVGIHKHYDKNGEPIVDVCDKEVGDVRLLYCGNTNCAGEVIALLKNLYARGVRRFLNIHPSICRNPVNAGTTLAYRLFGLEGLAVTNIAVNFTTEESAVLYPGVERFTWEDF